MTEPNKWITPQRPVQVKRETFSTFCEKKGEEWEKILWLLATRRAALPVSSELARLAGECVT